MDALLATRFPTRPDAYSALRIHEYTVNKAALESKPDVSGGGKAVYGCASPSCSLQYTVSESMKDGGYWYIVGPPVGIHNLCVVTKKRALGLHDVMNLPPVAAQLAIQNNRLQPNQVSSTSIAQAAKDCKIDLSSADVSRIQALNTAKLTDIALGGYDKIAWYCNEVVRLNPGTKAFLQVRCVATDNVSEHVYSTSTPPPYLAATPYPVSLSSPLPPVTSHLQLYSCIIFPASTYAIVKFSVTSIYSDFAHMYHFEHETKLLVWLLTTQLGGKVVGLGHGLVVGPENTYWWRYVREVRSSCLL